MQNGSVSAYGNVYFSSGSSSVTNSNVFANGNVTLTSQDRVRVNGGSVYAGNSVSGVAPFTNQVTSRTVNQNYSPAPVQPVSYYTDNFKYTDTDFANFMAQAQAQGNLHVGNYSPPPGNFTGIHYVTGDLNIGGNYTGDAVWVVNGNLRVTGSTTVANGKNFAFIVKGSVDTSGLGNGGIDGFIYANGAIGAGGNSTVNGGVISFGGISGTGNFMINYAVPAAMVDLPGGSTKFKIISLEQTS